MRGTRLQPPGLETTFWSRASPQLLSIDRTGATIAVALNALATAVGSTKFKLSSCGAIVWALHGMLWVSLLLHVWAVTSWRRYIELRGAFVWGLRSVRVATVCLIMLDRSYIEMMTVLATSESHSRTQALGCLLVTLPWVGFCNSLNLPLPFFQQLGAALVFLLGSLTMVVPEVGCALQHPSSQLLGASQRMCEAALVPLQQASLLLSGVAPSGPHIVPACQGASSAMALLLFLTMFAGAALPLQLTGLFERRAKVRFLEAHGVEVAQLQGGAHWAPQLALAALGAMLCGCAAQGMQRWDLFSVRNCSWQA